MRAVLIDDEYYALQGLKIELEEIGGIEVIGMFEDGLDALSQIERLSPEVVFLDIEMPGIDGLALFKKITEILETVHIVFVTAYSSYAVKAFDLNAIDYIVKPVQKERLIKTINRIPKEKKYIKKGTPLYITCFKCFSLSQDGKILNIGTRNRKAEELIAYLACEKGQYISKEKIAGALWPNLDGKKSMANLYLAHYYVKKQQKVLGLTLPVESVRGKMRLRIENVSLDLMMFSQYLESWKISREIKAAEKAASLYTGMVLEDSYYSWCDMIQQSYEIKYNDLLMEMLQFYKENKNTAKYALYKRRLSSD